MKVAKSHSALRPACLLAQHPGQHPDPGRESHAHETVDPSCLAVWCCSLFFFRVCPNGVVIPRVNAKDVDVPISQRSPHTPLGNVHRAGRPDRPGGGPSTVLELVCLT